MGTRHNNQLLRICFYLLWLLLGLLQAYHTELLADEAYYWKYAQDLQWGYFDHPPVVAAMIKPGYALLQNELGVRLLFVISSGLFIYLLELLVKPQKQLLFYLSVLSIGAFHMIGFLALPDMPLLLFSTSFLLVYKKYLNSNSWVAAILLAINIALLLLSKYYGILLIAFTILATPSILKRGSFWAIAVLSALLFLPHVLWQFAHDLPSIKYHLQGRSTGGYKVEYTINYLLSILIVFSPVTGIVLGWWALKRKTANSFDRTLKFLFIGFLAFFFLMTFKGRTEANWIATAIIPAVILGYKQCENKEWFRKFTVYATSISLLLICSLRLYMATDYFTDIKAFKDLNSKLHHVEEWATILHDKADGRSVVFMNKYQYAAWYEYYTGDTAISMNNRMGRRNQYNIWDDEYELQGKSVMIVPNYYIPGWDSMMTRRGKYQYMYLVNFRSAAHVAVLPEQKELQASPNEVLTITFSLEKTRHPDWALEKNIYYPETLHSMVFKKGEYISNTKIEFYPKEEMFTGEQQFEVTITAPEEPGKYELYLDIANGWLPPGINGEKIELDVTAP